MHKVGILGSAIVGQTLAQGFKTHGHDVRIGSRTARAIEPLCQLWCIPGFRQNSWTHVFAVLWP
jgi:2-polyprenyl-6-methoxyphenol hydroxylase-like FAD-dependent oxidoreductase